MIADVGVVPRTLRHVRPERGRQQQKHDNAGNGTAQATPLAVKPLDWIEPVR